jgi:glycosyltransferase involved in cell wall biosynthesis
MALVTVGLPFFDEERHLGDAIQSVLAQTFTDFELLLLDDGSLDGSLDVARSFRDPRITLIADGARRGLPARLNEIVRRAQSPYVARMDADDVMHPTRLARQLEVFEAQPAADVVGTWAALVAGTGEPFAAIEPPPPTPSNALRYGVLAHPTILARRSWFIANPYDATLTRTEDRDLWCRTVSTSTFITVPECLYVFRVDIEKRSFVASYLEGQRQNRAIFRKYGPLIVGRWETTRLIAAAHAKSIVMRTVALAGLADRLIRRRGRPLTERERVLAREALAAGAQRA